MGRLEFTGVQNTDKGDVNIDGYIEILQREEEFMVPIRGLITIHDQRNFTQNFSGSITQISLGFQPEITLYTDGNLGQKLFYSFDEYSSDSKKLVYRGKWCPIEGNVSEILDRFVPSSKPKISKVVSLEFLLKDDKDKLLLKEAGISV